MTIEVYVQKSKELTCCSVLRARHAQEMENCNTNTMKRMTMYWNRLRNRNIMKPAAPQHPANASEEGLC